MLTRFYVDNYKCFVNFEIRPDFLHLIIGLNGSGKSTVLHVLNCLQRAVIDAEPIAAVFPSDTLTRWQTRPEQMFEIEVELESDAYTYRLVVSHTLEKRMSYVSQEEVLLNGRPLFFFNEGEVSLYRDDFQAGVPFHWDRSRSGLSGVASQSDNTKLTRFKQWLLDLLCVKINPLTIGGRSEREVITPDVDMSNFASWYRHLQQENPSKITKLYEKLKEAIEGFDSLPLVQHGDGVRMLAMRMNVDGVRKPVEFSLAEISEGQRSLVILYTILYLAAKPGRTIIIDEPDNFVALREIQPWLSYLSDVCSDDNMQAILLSHHPDIINRFAPLHTSILSRGGGPVRVRPFQDIVTDDELMTPAELVATGDFVA